MNKNEDELHKLKTKVDYFINTTIDPRFMSQQCRDYYDGYQWTEEEQEEIKRRGQSPIVSNRIKPKIEGLKGLLEIRKTDIKAFPRNYENDEESAHAVTDALRYVSDNNDMDDIKTDLFENKIIEGYCAAETMVKKKKNEYEIRIHQISFDRFIFDPHSTEKDFSDSRYMGEMVWFDEEQINELFPNINTEDLLIHDESSSDDTFEDKPRWHAKQEGVNRFKIIRLYYKDKGKWHFAIFSSTIFLQKPILSPYLDEDGEPSNAIEADTAYIDRFNNRYGEVKAFIDIQDEINKRRSKSLHLLSSRQTSAPRGAIEDIPKMKREMAKPDGHIEYNSINGEKVEILNTNDMRNGQFEMYQDSKTELDSVSFNAQLAGERQGGDLSGKAIDKLQSAGTLEVNSLYTGFANFEKRIYRQVWARIKQFWDRQKWIRVTDDQDKLRWIGLNSEITLQQMLEEIINDKSRTLQERVGASAAYQQFMQTQDPRLQTIVNIKNNTAELDIDLTLEQSFDVVNIENEQFQILAQFAQSSQDIDIIELIELSQLRNKEKLIEKIEQRRAAASQAQQVQAQTAQVQNAKTYAEAQEKTESAKQKAIENQLLLTNPERVNSVSI